MSITSQTILIHVESGTYPLQLAALKTRHPNISFGTHLDEEFIRGLGYEEVIQVARPTADVVHEGTPSKDAEGKWRQFWIARSFDESEVAAQLEEAKNELREVVAARLASALEKGVPFNFGGEYGVQGVQMRDSDRPNILGLKQKAEQLIGMGITDPVIPLRTYEDNSVMLTPEQVVTVAWGVLEGYTEVMQMSWGAKDSIRSATTLTGLPRIEDEFVPTQRELA